jgi:hypothetical protein
VCNDARAEGLGANGYYVVNGARDQRSAEVRPPVRDTKERRYPNERTPIEFAERHFIEGVVHDIAEQESPPKNLFEERNHYH